jgi:hypothetical protein
MGRVVPHPRVTLEKSHPIKQFLDSRSDTAMDRAFANAIILEALEHDPERVKVTIAEVARSLAESGRYSAEEISAAVDELLRELEGHQQPRH